MRLQYCGFCALVRVAKDFTPAHRAWFDEHTGGQPGEFGCRGVTGARTDTKRHQWVDLKVVVAPA